MYIHFDINFRDVSRVQGMTREVLIALIADIESRNWREVFNLSNGIAVEHPRSSTTDDIECFFSITVGKAFTLKQVNKQFCNDSLLHNTIIPLHNFCVYLYTCPVLLLYTYIQPYMYRCILLGGKSVLSFGNG